MNEFKISAIRSIGGGEQITYTATLHSDKEALTEKQIDTQIASIDSLVRKGFRTAEQRNIDDKDVLAEYADIRREKVDKYTNALKAEMETKAKAELTMKEAERFSNRLNKK